MNSRVHKILLLDALLGPRVAAGRLAHGQAGKVPGNAMEWSSYGVDHALLAKTLLIVGSEGSTQREGSVDSGSVKVPNFDIHEATLCAYDKATGKVIGEVTLPSNASGTPMAFMLGDKQFISVPTGGSNLPAELIVLSLP